MINIKNKNVVFKYLCILKDEYKLKKGDKMIPGGFYCDGYCVTCCFGEMKNE
jgi:hypothetical protein